METEVSITKDMSAERINCTLRNGNYQGTEPRQGVPCINCTLRNGNDRGAVTRSMSWKVLIVPCGMETCLRNGLPPATNVLIVPCGMETSITLLYHFGFTAVLIVPCGMETKDGSIYTCWFLVLIVPCGMETR